MCKQHSTSGFDGSVGGTAYVGGIKNLMIKDKRP